MKPTYSTELRFASIVAAIVGVYVFVILDVAATYGVHNVISFKSPNPAMLAVWLITFSTLIVLWLLRLILLPSKTSILGYAKKDILEKGIRGDHLIMRATIFFGWYAMMLVFSPFKEMIGHITQFPLDRPIATFEHMLLGRDAWEYTHYLFGGAWPTFFLQMSYTAWFILMWLSVIFCIAKTDKLALRSHFMLAFLLTWILVGSLAANFLGSAGPCFYDQIFGGNRFAALNERLREIDASLKTVAPNLGIASLQMQDWLWKAYSQKDNLFGGGISAMPSVHVAVATIMAQGGYGIGKSTGRAMTGYAVLVWIASVHLGWHYALDGVVGALMAIAIWKFAGILTARYVLREAAPELQTVPA
jgi:hypothetical protein